MRGGQWSDTFAGSKVIPPDDDAMLLKWLENTENVKDAMIDYWVVVDDMRQESEELFESEDGSGILSGFTGDWPTETIFYDQDEAIRHAHIMNGLTSLHEMFLILEEHAMEEFRGYNSDLDYEEIEESIEAGEHRKDYEHSQYLDENYERFKVVREHDSRIGVMQEAAANKILDSDKKYPNFLVRSLKEYLFDLENGSTPQKKKFIEKYLDDYPDMAKDISSKEQEENISLNDYLKNIAAVYEKLPEGSEKDKIRNRLVNEIEFVLTDSYRKIYYTSSISDYKIALDDRLQLLGSFDVIPAGLVKKIAYFAESLINDDKIKDFEKRGVLQGLLNYMARTDTDSPDVQNMYMSFTPYIVGTPQNPSYGKPIPIRIGIVDFLRALAKLGENGKKFIPFLKQKINDIKYWMPSEGEPFYYPQNVHQHLKDKYEEKIKEYKLIQIERILYTIDSIESGQKRSDKYSFHSDKGHND
jgi:hypothetical protein